MAQLHTTSWPGLTRPSILPFAWVAGSEAGDDIQTGILRCCAPPVIDDGSSLDFEYHHAIVDSLLT